GRVPDGYYEHKGIAVGDVNSDGREDVAVADIYRGLEILRNHGPATPAYDPEAPFVGIRDMFPADFSWNVSTAVHPLIRFTGDVSTAMHPMIRVTGDVSAAMAHLVDGDTGAVVPSTLERNAGAHTVTVVPNQ